VEYREHKFSALRQLVSSLYWFACVSCLSRYLYADSQWPAIFCHTCSRRLKSGHDYVVWLATYWVFRQPALLQPTNQPTIFRTIIFCGWTYHRGPPMPAEDWHCWWTDVPSQPSTLTVTMTVLDRQWTILVIMHCSGLEKCWLCFWKGFYKISYALCTYASSDRCTYELWHI